MSRSPQRDAIHSTTVFERRRRRRGLRDQFISSAADRESGQYIMPCISRSKTPTLVLDL